MVLSSDTAKIRSVKGRGRITNLKGNVQIIFKEQHLSSDYAVVDAKNTTLTAEGNVSLVSPLVRVDAEKIVLDYSDNTGVLYNASVESGHVFFHGKVIKKTGERNYEVSQGHYTACTNCPPSWSFSGGNLKAELGGYATMKNPVFYVGGFPVFWLPYLLIPLKSKRQSGFLVPQFEFRSQGEKAFGLRYFWAMSPSHDSTWTTKFYTGRGLKLLGEYRYVLSDSSYGQLNAGFIADNRFKNSPEYLKFNSSSGAIPRWYIKYLHYYDLPGGYVHRARVNLVSDLDYPYEFIDEMPGYGEPALENSTSLTKNGEGHHLSMNATYNLGLLKEDPKASNEDSVHTIPEIKYSNMPKSIGNTNLHYEWDIEYTNFTRQGFNFDDENNNGVFDLGTDRIRSGQRVNLSPILSYPISLGKFFEILPSVNYKASYYQFAIGPDPSAYRQYLRGSVSGKTRISKVFETDDGKKYKHEIIPEASYTYIPWLEQSSHPFFGTIESEPYFKQSIPLTDQDTLIQFDYSDRLFDRHLITLGLTQKLIRKRFIGNKAQYQQIAYFNLSQSYDVTEAQTGGNTKQPWSDIFGLLSIRLDNFESLSKVRYFPYRNIAAAYARFRVKSERGNYAEIAYSHDFAFDNDNQLDLNSRTENLIPSIGYRSRYLDLSASLTYSLSSEEPQVTVFSYAVGLRGPGDCWVVSISQDVYSSAARAIKFSFNLLFDGQQR